MMKRVLTILLALIMISTLIGGCSSGSGTAAATTAESTAAATSAAPASSAAPVDDKAVKVETWEIPVISAITGPVAFVGEPALWAAQYAAEVINKEGGIRGKQVKITAYDDEFNPEKGVQHASNLVDKSLFILGCLGAPVSEAIGQVIYDAKVPNIGSYSFQAIRDQYKPYATAYMSDSEEGDLAAAKAWAAKMGLKKIVVFFTPSDASQTATKKLFEKELPAAGIEVAGAVEVETGVVDCGPAAVQALNYKADGYYLVLRVDEAAKVINELRTRGAEDAGKICSSFAALNPNLIKICGEKAEGTYFWNKLNPDYQGEDWQKLIGPYNAKFGANPSAPPVPGFYNAIIALKQCYEELEITGDPAKLAEERDAIANWLYNSPEIDGIQGKFSWKNGKLQGSPSMFIVKDGKFVSAGF